MATAVSATDVRSLVLEQFQRLGVDGVEQRGLLETILISDGLYRGRTYRAGELMAMWFADIGLVQFYGADGDMLGTFTLAERSTTPTQKAA